MLTAMLDWLWMVTVAVPRVVPSTIEVADTLTKGLTGTEAGAVYRPVAEIDPQARPKHPGPDTLQITVS
jgi:hypothetical protein